VRSPPEGSYRDEPESKVTFPKTTHISQVSFNIQRHENYSLLVSLAVKAKRGADLVHEITAGPEQQGPAIEKKVYNMDWGENIISANFEIADMVVSNLQLLIFDSGFLEETKQPTEFSMKRHVKKKAVGKSRFAP